MLARGSLDTILEGSTWLLASRTETPPGAAFGIWTFTLTTPPRLQPRGFQTTIGSPKPSRIDPGIDGMKSSRRCFVRGQAYLVVVFLCVLINSTDGRPSRHIMELVEQYLLPCLRQLSLPDMAGHPARQERNISRRSAIALHSPACFASDWPASCMCLDDARDRVHRSR